MNKTLQIRLQQMAGQAGSEPETTLRKLVVFRGGFTLDAATAVLQVPVDDHGLEDTLYTLRTWGFVTVQQTGPDQHAQDKHTARFFIDNLTAEQLRQDAAAVTEAAYKTHFDYFLELTRHHQAQREYAGLDVELANIEAAFEWVLGAGDAQAALWLAQAAMGFLADLGRYEQQAGWFDLVVAALANHPDRRLWATAQNTLGVIFQERPTGNPYDNLLRALHAYGEALKYLPPETEPDAYAMLQNNLGVAYHKLAAHEDPTANLERAITAFDEALRYRPADNLPLDFAVTQNNLGNVYRDLAAHNAREANLRRAINAYNLALKHRTADTAPYAYARTQANLGIACEELGDLAGAITAWREAEIHYRSLGRNEAADEVAGWIAQSNNQ